jgi:hypothetical protein
MSNNHAFKLAPTVNTSRVLEQLFLGWGADLIRPTVCGDEELDAIYGKPAATGEGGDDDTNSDDGEEAPETMRQTQKKRPRKAPVAAAAALSSAEHRHQQVMSGGNYSPAEAEIFRIYCCLFLTVTHPENRAVAGKKTN